MRQCLPSAVQKRHACHLACLRIVARKKKPVMTVSVPGQKALLFNNTLF